GSALYVASQNYRPVTGSTNTVWEWGTQITSFDLADPGNPILRDRLWFSGYGNAVAATDVFLFVASIDFTNWWQSNIRIIDITAPDGKMASYTSVNTAGRTQDKLE